MKKFFRKNKAAFIRAILIVVLTLLAYIVLHKVATVERGYEAIGGEACAFLIPYFLWVLPKSKDTAKAVKNNAE